MSKSILFKSFISIVLVITLILCSFIIMTQFTSLSVNAAATNGSWETVGNTINSNLNARTVAYNNKIYIISCNGDLGIFDTTTNTISLGEPIPYYKEMTTISATLYNDKIYVIGARPPSPMLYTFYIYDIASNTWTEGSNMQNAKVGSSITVHDGKIYAAGGFEFGYDDPSYIIDDIQAYDIQKDVWETVGSVQNGEDIITAAYNGNYYVLCPVTFTNVKNGIEITSVNCLSNAPEAVVQDENLIYSFEDKDLTIVDLLNDLTYDGAPIPYSVGYGYSGYNSCAAKIYNNKIYVASGSESPLQIYDIASNSWEVGPNLPEGSFNNQMQIINGKIYIIYDEKIICYELDRLYTDKTNTPIKTDQTNIKNVSAQRYSAVALTNDGEVLTWGDGSYDDLGHGSTLNKYTPRKVSGTFGKFISVAKGKNHTLAIDSNGNVWGWGNNSNGEIHGSFPGKVTIPRKIPGISNAVSISAGTGFSAAIKDDGTVWTWGNNDRGQLGRTDTSTKTPGQVAGLSEISKIACGENFIIALMDYDTIYSWGANTCGQLGDGTKADRATPDAISSSYSDISADREHVLAISGGKLYAWGQNSVGQLGLNDKIDRTTPTLVNSITGNVNSIGTGYNHSMAILSDGTLYTWGEGRDGQLGNGYYLTKRIPTKVSSLSNIAMATGGKDFTLAIDKNGHMWSFGTNAYGQLGLGE